MSRFVAASICLVIALCQRGGAQEEIIIADPRIDWRRYPAFYVDAPQQLASVMLSAVRNAVLDDHELCADGSATKWLCTDVGHRFFIGVTGDGTELLSGYACSQNLDIPQLRYYRENIVGFSPCVELNWDEDARSYEVLEAEGDE